MRRRSVAARPLARRTEERRAEIGSTGRSGVASQDTCRRTAKAAAAPAVAAANAAALGAADRNGIRDAASATQHRRREADRQLAGRLGGSESRAAAQGGRGEWRKRARGRQGRGQDRCRYAARGGRFASASGAGSGEARVGDSNADTGHSLARNDGKRGVAG